MTQNSNLLQNRKKACSSIPSATATMQKLSHLSVGILLGLTTLTMTAQANTTGAEEYRGSAAVDTSAPIAALSKLTSLDDDKPLTVTIPTIQQFKTKAGVPVRFVQTTALPIVDIDLRFNAGRLQEVQRSTLA